MRFTVLFGLVLLAALPVAAQSEPRATPAPGPYKTMTGTPAPRESPPRTGPCCVFKVWDAHGHEIGDVVNNAVSPPQPWGAAVAYRTEGGDAVMLLVTPDSFNGVSNAGSSSLLFTTPDCSGNSMFAMIYQVPLAKRYATVLNSGWPQGPGTIHAWLWITNALPVRAFPPPGTVFHSQWDNNQCSPYPAPGFTVNTGSGVGGFPMHRVEDLLAKYTRPFSINY